MDPQLDTVSNSFGNLKCQRQDHTIGCILRSTLLTIPHELTRGRKPAWLCYGQDGFRRRRIPR